MALLAGLAAVGLTIGCADSVRTSEPMYGSTAGAGGEVTAAAGGTLGAGGGALGGADQSGQAGATGTGGVVATGGSGGAAGGPPLLAPPAPAGLVSLNTDYQGTSLSLFDPKGGLLKIDGVSTGPCVHSTTQGNGVSKTISGDAVLPSQPQRGGDIVLVDRGNGALTFVDPAGCFIARQVAIPGGAKTNPHDVVILSDHKAYVTRYEANLAAASPQQMGNDVIAIDPVTGSYLSRINLDQYASTVAGAPPAGAPVLVRPDRAVIADGRVVVSLNQIDASYVSYGDGGVVVIDPATDMVVASVPLPGLNDCEGMDFVPATHMLLVACGGSYGSKDQLLQSGIAVVDLGASPPRLDHVVLSVAFDGHPISFGWVLAAPTAAAPNRAFAATYDPKGVAADALYQFDFTTGVVTPVTSAAAFSLGSAALADQLLFVPEALFKAPKVQLIDVAAGAQALSAFTPDTSGGLPPRQIAWY